MPENDFNFDVRHPDYARMLSRYEMAWDFWRGGVHVLNPDHDISGTRIVRRNTDSNDNMLPEVSSDYKWISGSANRSYLWRNPSEGEEDFNERRARQINIPVFQLMINIFVAGILKIPPRRGDEFTNIEPWGTYWEDVDTAKTNINSFIRQNLALAFVFGRCHAITDRPIFDSPSESRAHELARGDRAYSYIVTPLDLVDWSVDKRGNFNWIVVREEQDDERVAGSPLIDTVYQYRVWTRTMWKLYKESSDKEGTKFLFDMAGSHSCERVPLSTLWATRDNQSATMGCESPFADVLDLNRHIINKLSELDEVDRMQAFSLLWFPSAEGNPISGLDVSPFSAISSSGEGGAPRYISPDSSLAAGKLDRVNELLFMGRQYIGAGRGKSEYSKEERSAEALSAETEDKRNMMATAAAATEEFDRQIHEDVAKLEGQPHVPLASYSRDYDVKGVMTQIQEIVQLNSTSALGPVALSELVVPLVSRILSEHGADADKIETVIESMKAEAIKSVLAVDPGTPSYGA